jgi:lysophospholipase L1-like esterase
LASVGRALDRKSSLDAGAASRQNDRVSVSSLLSRWPLALIVAATVTACDKKDGPTSPSPDPAAPFYTVIGASDAIGYGASVPCAPFDLDCPDGTGYAQRVIRRLQGENDKTGYQNLGVPGQVLSPAVEALALQVGRDVDGNFIDRQAPFVRPETTMLSIFAGGNDANVIGQAVTAGLGGADPRVYIDAQVRQWGDDYRTLIDRVRVQAPAARIVAINLPNMGAAPYVAARPVEERSILQRIAVGLADQVNSLAGRDVLIVDLLCDARIYAAANFSADGFHPSDQGYALIADLLYPALASGLAHAPLATCPGRTLLPAY